MIKPVNALQPNSHVSAAQQARFGAAAIAIDGIDKAYSFMSASRGRQLIIEDLAGFAVLRTLMDLFRQYFFKETQDEKKSLNFAAARERLLMETTGTAPDPMAGLIGVGIGKLLDQSKTGFNKTFTSMDSVELFDSLIKQGAQSPGQFAYHLAKTLDPKQSKTIATLLEKGIAQPAQAEHTAFEIAGLLGQKQLDIKVGKNWFALNELMNDAHHFLKTAGLKGVKPSSAWAAQLEHIATQAAKTNAIRIPAALAAGLGLNFVMPHLIHLYTKKRDNIDDFPGVQGLREMKKNANRQGMSKVMPYLTDSLKEGKIWPWLTTALWLPIITGMVDTYKLATHGVKASLNLPGKGFGTRFLKIMQFGKAWPYVGAQQAALMYGACVAARMALSRTNVEFRERAVDGFLGWSIFILGTPIFQKGLAKLMDKNLLKEVDGSLVLKSRAEVAKFMSKSALTKFKIIGPASMLATIGLLGIVEPYLSIKWSEWQTRRDAKKEAKAKENALLAKKEKSEWDDTLRKTLDKMLPIPPDQGVIDEVIDELAPTVKSLRRAGPTLQSASQLDPQHAWKQPTFFYQHAIWQHPQQPAAQAAYAMLPNSQLNPQQIWPQASASFNAPTFSPNPFLPAQARPAQPYYY